ncbi:hypothetical protein I4U23_015518 [Adineta vaga]|nr:hypothetical protein I4U23_015518 [Adineta vaga]
MINTYFISIAICMLLGILFLTCLWNRSYTIKYSLQPVNLNMTAKIKRNQLNKMLFVWIFHDVYENDQLRLIIKHLKQIASYTFSLNDYDDCKLWLMKSNHIKNIHLVVSDTFARRIVPYIHHLRIINAIHVYSKNSEFDQGWSTNYNKVRKADLDMKFLMNYLPSISSRKFKSSKNSKHDLLLVSSVQGDFTKIRASFDMYIRKSLVLQTSFDKYEKILSGNLNGLDYYQFVVVDITKRISPLATAMLKSLIAMTENAIIIFQDNVEIDFIYLSGKITCFFASSQFVAAMTDKPKGIFILEDDKEKIDNRQRFASGEHLVLQLADELYRSYIDEASRHLKSGNTMEASIKQEVASKIDDQLKKIHKSMSLQRDISESQMDMTVTVVWLKSKQNNSEVEGLRSILDNIVTLFQPFNNVTDCFTYKRLNILYGTIFLIVDNDYDASIVANVRQFLHAKRVYCYGETSSEHEAVIDDYNDLCFELITDLASHYSKLGFACSTREDKKTAAKIMFDKASKLYKMLVIF